MRLRGIHPEAILFILLLILPGIAFGRSGVNVDINGFFLGNFAGRLTGQRPDGDESSGFLLAEERLRLDVSAWPEIMEASARVKGDFFHDAVSGEFDIDLREAYLDYSTGDFDFRLGRQIATWGVGDLIFINDVFPKDWESFFSGRPLEYLKIGVDGFRLRYSSNIINAVLFVIPFFEPDHLPTAARFSFFDPFVRVPAREEKKPTVTYENTEAALRLYRKISNIDVSLYAYRGFWRTPGIHPDNLVDPARVTAFYPALSVYGVSVQGRIFRGVFSFEAGYYDSRDDEDGDDPETANSQARFLGGYQRRIWRDADLEVQYYAEVMADYSAYRKSLPAGFPARREYRDVVTFRLDQLLAHQAWKISMICFYSPAEKDYLLQPLTTYKFSDSLAVTAGANIFGGKQNWTFFGQFDKNDNVYLSLRFDF